MSALRPSGNGSRSSGDAASVLDGETRQTAEAIIARYPNKRSAALPLLFLVQSVEGYVTEAGMREIASMLGLTPAEVLATASFYTMLKKRPQGEYLISVCRNISCTHMGARAILRDLVEHLGVDVGEKTRDGKFTIETAECLATCDGAPSLQINYEDFYDATSSELRLLVDKLSRGDEIRSARGERIRTAHEISYETATAGLHTEGTAGDTVERTIGGESPRVDTAPGFRPKEGGFEESG